MYPEGTRSPDGRLYKGKTGLARLALQTGVPVIPVAMIGTDVVNPPGSKMWRFGRVQVKFGKPMDFSRFEGLAGNRFIERAVIDEVMYELMRLSGQEYVDLYAADVKEGKEADAGNSRPSRRRGIAASSGWRADRRDPADRGARHRPCHRDHRQRPPHIGPAGELAPQRRRGFVVLGHQRDRRPHHQRHPAAVTTASATLRWR